MKIIFSGMGRVAFAILMSLSIMALFTNCKKENMDDWMKRIKGQKDIHKDDGKEGKGTKDGKDRDPGTKDDRGQGKDPGTKGDDGKGKDKDPGTKGDDGKGKDKDPGTKGDGKDGKGKDPIKKRPIDYKPKGEKPRDGGKPKSRTK